MPRSYLIVIFALVALYVVLFVTMRLLRGARRRVERPLQTDFTLADLHRLVAQGKLRPDEFERLKEVLLAHRAPLARKLDPSLADLESRPEKGKRGFDVIPNPPPPPARPDDRRDAL